MTLLTRASKKAKPSAGRPRIILRIIFTHAQYPQIFLATARALYMLTVHRRCYHHQSAFYCALLAIHQSALKVLCWGYRRATSATTHTHLGGGGATLGFLLAYSGCCQHSSCFNCTAILKPLFYLFYFFFLYCRVLCVCRANMTGRQPLRT